LATRAINPVIRIWQAISFPFNSSIRPFRVNFDEVDMTDLPLPDNETGHGAV
jgi:hypothetical protein